MYGWYPDGSGNVVYSMGGLGGGAAGGLGLETTLAMLRTGGRAAAG